MLLMDNLFILLQKDKKLKRQFEILRFLNQKDIVSADKISATLNIHRATLISDVDSLKEILPDEVTITRDFRNGYLLNYPENNTIDYYIAQIAKDTMVYKIINRLYLSDEANLDVLADEFYTSEPVIIRLISHMNKTLKSYHISIAKQPLKFIGNEADIRTFIFAFYRTFMDYYTLESRDEIYEQSYEKMIGGLKKSTLHRNKAKVFLWANISKTRILNNYFIEVNEELQAKVRAQETYSDYRDHYFINFKSLLTAYHLEGLIIPETEVIWAYLASLDCIEYVDKNEIETYKSDLYRFEEENQENIELEKNLYDIMATYFNLNQVDEAQFKTIVAYVINISLLSDISQNFQKVSTPLKRYVQNSFKDTYEIWTQILATKTINEVVVNNPEDIAVTLTMLTTPIINNHLKGSLNVLFSFEAEAGFSSVLEDSSKLILFPSIHAIYTFSSAVTPEFIKENKINILVSNFKQQRESQLGCQIFHLSYLPTLTEWTQLRNKIIKSLGW